MTQLSTYLCVCVIIGSLLTDFGGVFRRGGVTLNVPSSGWEDVKPIALYGA